MAQILQAVKAPRMSEKRGFAFKALQVGASGAETKSKDFGRSLVTCPFNFHKGFY